MKQKKRFKVIIYFLAIILAILFLFPFIWLILSSLKSKAEIFSIPMTFFPNEFQFNNYSRALSYIPLLKYTWNTFLVALGATIGAVFFSSFTGYAFSKINWKGRDKMFILVLATLMIPYQIVMIPLFVMFTQVGLTNTLWSLILPRFFDAFYIFLMRQAFYSIPDEIIEAAKIDGCNHFKIFRTIAFPLVKSSVVTVIIFEINARWQDFMGPLIFLKDQEKYTMAIGLSSYTTLYGTEWDLLLAASVMFTIPMVVVFLVFQKYFITGIATSGLKG